MHKFTLALIITLGIVLRALHLEWQPLWWDEGYSIYVSTESLTQMLWLTAHDIHPPLYYALLHGWLTLWQSSEPLALRTFSVFVGGVTLPLFAWMIHTLFPQRRRPLLIGAMLLVINPLHLYYSQEVRMYALALALGIASTIFYWKLQTEKIPDKRKVHWIAYALTISLALYTLYYSSFLLIAHFAHLLWTSRRSFRSVLAALSAQIAAGLLYLPWLLYAGPKLVLYVDDKVIADADQALNPIEYAYKHLLAFVSGHLVPDERSLALLRYVALAALLLLLVALVYTSWKHSQTTTSETGKIETEKIETNANDPSATSLLWFLVCIPTTIAFGVNLYRPFFPDGGERLLLFVLPYFLLLVANGLERQWSWRVGKPLFAALLIGAVAGITNFYTQPRYADRDYRPLVRQVVQQGNDDDTILAIFPWQVGFWRAYSTDLASDITQSGAKLAGPRPLLLGQGSLQWNAQLVAQIDTILGQGTLWFPAPESLGSTLPGEIESYLRSQMGAARPLNLENRWANPTTRLTAWRRTPTPTIVQPVDVQWTTDFAIVQLVGSRLTATEIESANQPLGIELVWDLPSVLQEDLRVSLRLQDAQSHVWANRDYEPLGAYTISTQNYTHERVGLIVPVGLPPGPYDLVLGIGPSDVETLTPPNPSQDAISANGGVSANGSEVVTVIGQINITAPSTALPPQRLPIQRLPTQRPVVDVQSVNGLSFLGFSGYERSDQILAGDAFRLSLFLQSHIESLPAYHLYMSLLDEDGASVAGWEGWSLPNYPTSDWNEGALAQVPVAFFLPATVPSGDYQLITGLIDPATGVKSAPVALGPVLVGQRVARFVEPAIAHKLSKPVQFGTHITLLGYNLEQMAGGGTIELLLHWQVQQTLLPPHHIFVHLDSTAANGDLATLAQDDGPPISFAPDIAMSDAKDGVIIDAPSGSWQAGEHLTSVHRLALPDGSTLEADGQILMDGERLMLTVGLYDPETGARLPASVGGEIVDDSATLTMPE